MALDGCGLFCKYTLFIFNLIFALVGFAFLGLGLWLRFSSGTRPIFQIEELNSSAFVMAVTVLIVLGSVMLIVVAFGDYGACNEKKCALQVFSVLLSILAVAVVAVGVVGFSNKDAVGLKVVEFYTSMYTLYVSSGGDPVIGVTLKFIHSSLHCCGLTGFKVAEIAKDTCPAAEGFLEHIKMDSCLGIIATVFDSKAQLILGVFIGTGVLLLIALICSSTLSKKIPLSNSSPQYIVLTQSSVLANPQSPQHGLVSTTYPYPYPYPDQDPVTFTPLSAANIPLAQS